MNTSIQSNLVRARTESCVAKSGSKEERLALISWNHWSLIAARNARTVKEAQWVYYMSSCQSKGQCIAWKKMRPLFKIHRQKRSTVPRKKNVLVIVVSW
ncbi:MAG: hypothetical protein WCW14_00200 [Candidatus Paceibacterota bacterium]|jgi:hypothetical protein